MMQVVAPLVPTSSSTVQIRTDDVNLSPCAAVRLVVTWSAQFLPPQSANQCVETAGRCLLFQVPQAARCIALVPVTHRV